MKTPSASVLLLLLRTALVVGLAAFGPAAASAAEWTCPAGTSDVCFEADDLDKAKECMGANNYDGIMRKSMKFCIQDHSTDRDDDDDVVVIVQSDARRVRVRRQRQRLLRRSSETRCKKCIECDDPVKCFKDRRLLSERQTLEERDDDGRDARHLFEWGKWGKGDDDGGKRGKGDDGDGGDKDGGDGKDDKDDEGGKRGGGGKGGGGGGYDEEAIATCILRSVTFFMETGSNKGCDGKEIKMKEINMSKPVFGNCI